MIKGTFCDWLMMQGVEFHPETVILEATSVYKELDGYYDDVPSKWDYSDINNLGMSIPLFNHTFIEYKLQDHWTGVYISRGTNERANHFFFSLISGSPEYGEIRRYKYPHLHIYEGGYLTVDGAILKWSRKTPTQSIQTIKSFMPKYNNISVPCRVVDNEDPPKEMGSYWCTILIAMTTPHTKTEIELVDYPRNYRRRQKRKTGKEPSPYFRIINPEQTEKEYEHKKPSQKTGIKMPLHIVRGHFRTTIDHPLEQFNGTRWISAHTKGDKKLGELKKGYTIRLPEAKDD